MTSLMLNCMQTLLIQPPHWVENGDGIRIYTLPRKKKHEGEKRKYEQEKYEDNAGLGHTRRLVRGC